MNRLVKEYDNAPAQLSEEIRRLEEENVQLSQEIKSIIEKSQANGNHAAAIKTATAAFSSPAFTNGNQSINSNGGFEVNFFSPTSQQESFPVDDPFQTFDPFKDASSDPFKTD